MASSENVGVWGLDIGQCALKALRLEVADGELVATAFDYIEHPKILSQPDADPDELTRAALEQFLSRNDVRGDEIALAVPGQTGLARFVKLPPVEAKKIPDIVRFEAKQQIPFPLDEVVWDYQTISGGTPTDGFVENEIGLFAMKRDLVARYLQALREVKLEVHYVQMTPLALCNFATFDLLGRNPGEYEGEAEQGRKACTVVVDMGADNTNLVVTDGARIIWQRPIPIGGNHFTRILTKELKLTFAKAEHLKRNATKAEDPKAIFQAMRPVFADFVGEIQRSLGFFTNTHRDADIQRLVGLGNGFRLPGLGKFIAQSLNIEVERLGAFQRLTGDEVVRAPVFRENLLSFGVAYGLALQGLGLARIHTNLLPQEIQLERMVRSKKPWAALAAACLVVGTAVTTYFFSGDYQRANAAAQAAQKDGKPVLDQKARYDSEFRSAQNDLKAARIAAQAVLRGGEERQNWPLLLRYINECLPQPNGSGLDNSRPLPPDNLTAYQRYWNEAAQRAARNKRERDEKGVRDETDLNALLQIVVQAVYGRYCRDESARMAFYANARESSNEKESFDPTDWAKPPEKPGWVIEVRGYTYHSGKQRFVMDTFLQNLRHRKQIYSPLGDPSMRPVPVAVSHVGMLRYHTEPNISSTHPPAFRLVSATPAAFVNSLIRSTGRGAAGGSAGMGTLGAQGAAGAIPGQGGSGATGTLEGGGGFASAGGDWTGLGTGTRSAAGAGAGFGSTGASGGSGLGLPDVPGMPGGSETGSPDSGPGINLPGQRGGAPGASQQRSADSGRTNYTRTEFVIVLYWEEPLPSGDIKPAGPGAGGGTFAPPGYPGAPGGVSGPPAGYPGAPGSSGS